MKIEADRSGQHFEASHVSWTKAAQEATLTLSEATSPGQTGHQLAQHHHVGATDYGEAKRTKLCYVLDNHQAHLIYDEKEAL